MLKEILRFNRLAQRELQQIHNSTMSAAEFCRQHKFGTDFLDLYLIPLGASIWSANPNTYLDFPIATLLTFLNNHGLISLGDRPTWRTVTGGSKVYVDALAQHLATHGIKVVTSSPISSIDRSNQGVTLHSYKTAHAFDACIVASHSDQALAMLNNPTDLEKQTLGNIAYESNSATLHTCLLYTSDAADE